MNIENTNLSPVNIFGLPSLLIPKFDYFPILYVIRDSSAREVNKNADSYSTEILEPFKTNKNNYVLLNYIIILCSWNNWSQWNLICLLNSL